MAVDQNWTAHDVGQKPKHRSEASRYMYEVQRKQGHKSYIDKPHVKVFIHNGTTVYETNNHRAAWEKRYAQYVDSINTGPDAPRARVVDYPTTDRVWIERRERAAQALLKVMANR